MTIDTNTTVLILGDQLSTTNAALSGRSPEATRVLMVESASATDGAYHRQRLHLVLAAMRRFRDELEAAGFEVDYRRTSSFAAGLAEHRAAFDPDRIRAMAPTSWDMEQHLVDLGVDLVPDNQFLVGRDDFAAWADGRSNLVMEDFYRWQRVRLGYLMDGDQPAGGRWNHQAWY